ncbi:Mobile element protein [Mycobacterium tuberculosis variant bovis BCG str. ATCC 35743]|nr:Mobile element protein [Mycobacterium tuberculosis variant bovis BCG str. ATCC 35743]
MRIRLTAGQAGDNPQLLPLLDDYRHASTEYALGSTDFRLLADKAYSHPSTRAALRSKKIKHTIPERQDQIDRRKGQGVCRRAGHQHSTPRSTGYATPSNAASIDSSSGAASQPATTNTP